MKIIELKKKILLIIGLIVAAIVVILGIILKTKLLEPESNGVNNDYEFNYIMDSDENYDENINDNENNENVGKETSASDKESTNKTNTTTKKPNSIINETTNQTPTISNNTTQKRKDCPYGYTLDGDNCYKEYKAKTEYKCVEGKEASGYCIINTTVEANVTYTCQSGYTLTGTTCAKRVVVYVYDSSNYADVPETIRIQYYNSFLTNCNNANGQVETVDGKKYCYDYEYLNPTITYDCKGKTGELAGNMCISAKTVEAFAKSSCPDGGSLQSNGKCRITVKAD